MEKKRVWSVFLIITMLIGMLPFSAIAEEGIAEDAWSGEETAVAADPVMMEEILQQDEIWSEPVQDDSGTDLDFQGVQADEEIDPTAGGDAQESGDSSLNVNSAKKLH